MLVAVGDTKMNEPWVGMLLSSRGMRRVRKEVFNIFYSEDRKTTLGTGMGGGGGKEEKLSCVFFLKGFHGKGGL